MTGEHKQVLVAGDKEVRRSGDRGTNNVRVLGVSHNTFWDRRGFGEHGHFFDEIENSGTPFIAQAVANRKLGTSQHVFELNELFDRRDHGELAVDACIKQSSRGPVPKNCTAYEKIGVNCCPNRHARLLQTIPRAPLPLRRLRPA